MDLRLEVPAIIPGVSFRPQVWQARGAVRSRRSFSEALPEIPLPHSHQLGIPEASRCFQGGVSTIGLVLSLQV